MQSISSLVQQISKHYPEITFLPGDSFLWSPQDKHLFFNPSGQAAFLLHELGHAVLNHARYMRDIELLAMEREAWHYAHEVLSPRYAVRINDATVQAALDSYREWLHERSTCPHCGATGIQIQEKLYRCLSCFSQWQVNQAIHCMLRRYIVAN